MSIDDSHKRGIVVAVAIAAAALLLRENFLLSMHVDVPIRGDIRQYVVYALNLYREGVFSSGSGIGPVVPDGFRGPGYPAFLALAMVVVRGDSTAWYPLALHLQALMGAATVLLTVFTARRFMGLAASGFAGVLLAFWPHHIAASGALLSEVLFGFLISASILAAAVAVEDRKNSVAWLAGIIFGCAYLTNPVAVFLPIVLVPACWRMTTAPVAARILLTFLVIVAAWSGRNLTLPPGSAPSRAAMNFVEGSWPEYHSVWQTRLIDPAAASTLARIMAEERSMSEQPLGGLLQIGHRVAERPGAYAKWYFLEKPYLLWDWDIRIGAGGIYVLEVTHSPLDRGVLGATTWLLQKANGTIFFLACFALLHIAFRRTSGRTAAGATMAAAAVLYLTAVHVVFQSEPRYSIAYRPLELMLATYAAGLLLSWCAKAMRAR